MEPGEALTLKELDPEAVLGDQCRGRASRRTAPDDDHVRCGAAVVRIHGYLLAREISTENPALRTGHSREVALPGFSAFSAVFLDLPHRQLLAESSWGSLAA